MESDGSSPSTATNRDPDAQASRATEERGTVPHAAPYPATRYSALDALGSDDPEVRARSLEVLATAYWRPVYAHVRLKWRRGPEDAEDLTQEFFARAFAKRVFDAYDPDKGRFRTFLRTCLDRFVANEAKARRRLKRGGGVITVRFDFHAAESELSAGSAEHASDVEAAFDREWVAALFRVGVERLRTECEAKRKQVHFRLFETLVLADEGDKRSYAALAEEFGISVYDVTNYLAYARREFRRHVLEQLRAITATEEEFKDEVRAVLGA